MSRNSPAQTGRNEDQRIQLNRRRFVAAGAATFGASAPFAASAQPSTPAPTATAEASPVASGLIDQQELLALSETLVGVSPLPEDGVLALAELISAAEEDLAAYGELAEVADPAAPDALNGLSEGAQELARSIMTFWYVGMYGGEPSPDREERYFSLAAWQTVPYVTMLTVCKDFGYWAQDVPVTFE